MPDPDQLHRASPSERVATRINEARKKGPSTRELSERLGPEGCEAVLRLAHIGMEQSRCEISHQAGWQGEVLVRTPWLIGARSSGDDQQNVTLRRGELPDGDGPLQDRLRLQSEATHPHRSWTWIDLNELRRIHAPRLSVELSAKVEEWREERETKDRNIGQVSGLMLYGFIGAAVATGPLKVLLLLPIMAAMLTIAWQPPKRVKTLIPIARTAMMVALAINWVVSILLGDYAAVLMLTILLSVMLQRLNFSSIEGRISRIKKGIEEMSSSTPEGTSQAGTSESAKAPRPVDSRTHLLCLQAAEKLRAHLDAAERAGDIRASYEARRALNEDLPDLEKRWMDLPESDRRSTKRLESALSDLVKATEPDAGPARRAWAATEIFLRDKAGNKDGDESPLQIGGFELEEIGPIKMPDEAPATRQR